MANLSPWIRQQFSDGSGVPLAGGFVHFFVAGSSALRKTTWKDYLGATANENPVPLDSTGTAKIFGTGLYDVEIYDALGVLIEQVRGADFGGGASGTGSYIIVENYAALRALAIDYDIVDVLGRETANDGGQGRFQLSALVDTDDDGIILQRGTSRYLRILSDYIDPRWYGVVYGSAATQTTYMHAAFQGSVTWHLPVLQLGSTYLGSRTVLPAGASLIARGQFVGPGVELLLSEGSTFDGGLNCISGGVNAIFESGVCDALRLSWFTDGTGASRWSKAFASTSVGYTLLADIDTDCSSDIIGNSNIAVDFVAGARINVTDTININIPVLLYTGSAQIVAYADLSYVGTVRLGNGYAYLEWFGGSASTDMAGSNAIPWLASIRHGKVYLLASVGSYDVPAGTYTAPGDVEVAGYIQTGVVGRPVDTAYPSTLRFSGSITSVTGKLRVVSAKIDGYGSLLCSDFDFDNAVVSNTVSTVTGIAAPIGCLTVDPQYVAVGANGKLLVSSDLVTWTAKTLSGTVAMTSVVYSGSLYVAVGANGTVYTSADGDTWTQRTSGVTDNLTKVMWAEGKFVAVGASGRLIYSTDGISWNIRTVAAFDIVGVTYFDAGSVWVVVGTGGSVYVSADLTTWSQRVLTGLTTTVYDVASSDTVLVATALGAVYRSVDGNSFQRFLLPTAASVTAVLWSANKTKWVAATSTGDVLTSTDAISWSMSIKNIAFHAYLYDIAECNGTVIFAGASGSVLLTSDFRTYTTSQPVNTYDCYGVAAKTGMVVVAGPAGAIAQTTDMRTWEAQTPVTSADYKRLRKVRDVYYALGTGGIYSTSRDGATWTARSIGASVVLHDVDSNTAGTLHVIVGAGGAIYTSADPLAASPSWVSRTSGVSTELTHVAFIAGTSTWYVYGASGTVLTSSDGTTWTNVSATSLSARGIVSNGTVTVRYGASGGIVSTVDGAAWVRRTSNTTNTLLGGAYGDSKFVLCGVAGTILTSTDGIAWTVQTSGTSAQLNHVEFANGMFVACGSSGVIIKSANGVTWTGSLSGVVNNLNSVRHYDYWYVCGVGGTVLYSSDLTTWNAIISQFSTVLDPLSAHDWVDLVGSNDGTSYWAIGVYDRNGYMAITSNYFAGRWYKSTFAPENNEKLTKTFGSLILGEDGAMSRYSGCGRGPTTDGTVVPVLVLSRVYTDSTDDFLGGAQVGTKSLIVSNYTMLESTDTVSWKATAQVPTGSVQSLVVATGTMYLLSDGVLYSTTDGVVFSKIKDAEISNAFAGVGGKYLLLEDDSVIEEATTPTTTGFTRVRVNNVAHSLIDAGLLVLNGVGVRYYLGDDGVVLVGSVSGMTLTATGSADIHDSIIDVPVGCAEAGTVSGSTLVSVGKIGTVSDTTLTAMTGTLAGNVSRCSITTYTNIGVSEDISVVDTKLVQRTEGYDLLAQSDSVSLVALTNCDLRMKGLLLYSLSTDLIVSLYGGFVDSNRALTNGYAKVYLNGVSTLDGLSYTDVSAHSINGSVYEGFDLAAGEIVTAATSGWYHKQSANLSVDVASSSLLLTGAVSLSAGYDSSYSLRYRKASAATKVLMETGGRLRLDVTFPAGYSKEEQAKVQLRPILYVPPYALASYMLRVSSNVEDFFKVNNCGVAVSGSSFAGTTKDAGSVGNIACLWSGMRELRLGFIDNKRLEGSTDPNVNWSYDRWNDRFGVHYGQVLYNKDLQGIVKYDSAGTASEDDVLNHAPYIIIESANNCVLPSGTKIKLTVEPSLPLSSQAAWLGEDVDLALDLSGANIRTLNLSDLNTAGIKLRTVVSGDSQIADEKLYLGNPTAGWTYAGLSWYQNPDPAYIYPGITAAPLVVRVDVEGLAPDAVASVDGHALFTRAHYRSLAASTYTTLAEVVL
jgi:hypothetical protein